MSDNLRRFRVIRTALNELYPKQPQGNLARHLNTMAAMISGIVGSHSTNFPKMASKVPDGNKPESREQRFSRWVNNSKIEDKLYFLPFAEILLASLISDTLILAMDGSAIGRNCVCLMMSVIYKKRALPITWIVVEGNKGHLPEEAHIDLVQQVKSLIPDNARVVLLGDGEFDGIDLQAVIKHYEWEYVFRTADNIKVFWDGRDFHCNLLSNIIEPGYLIGVPGTSFTNEKYGPVMVICCWREKYKDPI